MAARGQNGSRGPGSGRRDGRSTPRRPTTTASPTKSAKSAAPQPEAESGARVTTRAVILLAVGVLFIASYTASIRVWWNQRAEIHALQAQNRQTKAEIAELKDLQERWDDPAYVKQQARERFGWVMPGEVGYRVIGADGQVKGPASQLAEPKASTQGPWLDRLWGSVVAAGEGAADSAETEPYEQESP